MAICRGIEVLTKTWMDLVLGKLVWLCDTKNQMMIILESSNDKKHDNPETLI